MSRPRRILPLAPNVSMILFALGALAELARLVPIWDHARRMNAGSRHLS